MKKIADVNDAASFVSKEECQRWINGRVVRFKLMMNHLKTPHGTVPLPQKVNGEILDTAASGYTKSELDEPLSRHAKPSRVGEKWFAVFKLKK